MTGDSAGVTSAALCAAGTRASGVTAQPFSANVLTPGPLSCLWLLLSPCQAQTRLHLLGPGRPALPPQLPDPWWLRSPANE